ncbi:MAG TPA: ATP-binding protein, partial [Parvularculaceae bacterium]|nr:ATP-binding protein [Parvularculaceae bacterium]
GAAVARATIAADAAGVRIENRTVAGDDNRCWCDEARAAQAIDHVLRIALRASPKGARVFVRAAPGASGWPEIHIRDRGEGLAPEEVRQALAVFDEVHRGLDRSFAGPGVGFAIAKTFVEIQGGRFEIDSRQGQGVLVRISLPRPEADVKTSESAGGEPVRMAG